MDGFEVKVKKRTKNTDLINLSAEILIKVFRVLASMQSIVLTPSYF